MKTDEQGNNKGTLYEIGCLFVPVISDKDALVEIANLKTTLEKLACEFLSGDGPALKSLAYPMKKMMGGEKNLFKEAYFVWLKFRSSSDKLIGLKKDLDKYDNILRYLIMKTTEKDTFVVSSQKKVLATKVQEEKTAKVIKLVKIVKPNEEVLEGEIKKERKEKPKSKDLDETIDKLVIK